MIDINAILEQSPYSLNREEKGVLMNQVIRELTKYHAEHCEPYRKILQALNLALIIYLTIRTYLFYLFVYLRSST